MASLYKRGNRWYIYYYLDGKRHRFSAGKDKKLAELKLKEVEVKLAKRELFHIVEKPVLDYLDEYLAYARANKSSRSVVRDREALSHLLSFLPSYTSYLHEITPAMIETYKKTRLETVKPTTVNRDLNTIKHFFNLAVEWGYLKESPARRVKKFKDKEQRRPRFLTATEVQQLLFQAAESLRAIILVLLYTGLRRDELVHMDWSDVDFDREVIEIRTKDSWHPKDYEPRTIPLHPNLKALLLSLERNGSRVFGDGKDGFVMRPESLTRAFGKLAKRVGLSEVTLHSLRHTFASHLVMAGQDLRSVQELLGHASLAITQKYAHLSPGHLKGVVGELNFEDREKGKENNEIQ